MGEAKRKAERFQQWEASLNAEERVIASVARSTFDRFIAPMGATGMCYRMAFFLSAYLSRERSISVSPVIGYVHDGTGDVMTSHAWVEFNGRKTDISLAITDEPSVQLEGELLIHDHVLRAGHRYTYHRKQSDAAAQAVERIAASSPQLAAAMAHKDAEHQMMSDLAADPAGIMAYLNGAPDGYGYDTLARIVGPGR